MSLRLLRLWWLHRVPAPHAQLVLLLGSAIRASGILMLAFTIPAVWGHLAHPWHSALLALAMAAENLAVALWWLRQRAADARALWVDLPVGVAAIVIGTWLAPRHGVPGWTLFAYPNTVLLSFVSGMLCRGVGGAVTCGALWASADVAATLALRDAGAGSAIPPALGYLVNSLVGWRGGSMLRRNEERLAAALAVEVRETAELAAAEQRWRLATALHDGVLQTLETLHRGAALGDPVLRAEVADRADWLRRYIETGHAGRSEDLGADLDAVAAAARQAGIAVEVNAARLLDADDDLLAAPQREAVVTALFHTVSAFGPHPDGVIMVRAVPEAGGVLVTVLSTGGAIPSTSDLADAAAGLASAGGRLRAAPVPCIEMWVPGGG